MLRVPHDVRVYRDIEVSAKGCLFLIPGSHELLVTLLAFSPGPVPLAHLTPPPHSSISLHDYLSPPHPHPLHFPPSPGRPAGPASSPANGVRGVSIVGGIIEVHGLSQVHRLPHRGRVRQQSIWAGWEGAWGRLGGGYAGQSPLHSECSSARERSRCSSPALPPPPGHGGGASEQLTFPEAAVKLHPQTDAHDPVSTGVEADQSGHHGGPKVLQHHSPRVLISQDHLQAGEQVGGWEGRSSHHLLLPQPPALRSLCRCPGPPWPANPWVSARASPAGHSPQETAVQSKAAEGWGSGSGVARRGWPR